MTAQPELSGLCKSARLIVLVLVCAAIATIAVVMSVSPVLDNDFWWHLKTGELIVRTGSLPVSDPFAYPQPPVPYPNEKFLMTSYWLSQSILYLFYSVAGFKGVILLRLLLLASLVAAVYLRMRRLCIDPIFSLSIIAASLALFGQVYSLDRPQICSFICAAILIGLFERIREGRKPSWTLFPLMILWANLHGGFIMGCILLGLFVAGALIQYRKEPGKASGIALWGLLGVLASLINPNGYNAALFMFRTVGTSSLGFINEYIDTFAAFAQGYHLVAVLWGLILLVVAGMIRHGKPYWPDIALTAFLAYGSLSYLRNVAFFSVAMAPVAAYYIDSAFIRGRLSAKGKGWLLSVAVLALLPLYVAGNMLVFTQPVRMWSDPEQYMTKKFPVSTARFINSSGISGNMFNDYNWGGYLLWKLGPQKKVFIDGRVVRPAQFDDYLAIAKADMEMINGIPKYRAVLDSYRIDYLVQPPFQAGGQLQPLMKFMLNDPLWVPVYLDPTGYLLVKKSDRNRAVIERYAIERLAFVDRLLAICSEQIAMNPAEVKNYIAKAEMLIYLGRYREASSVLQQGKTIAPASPDVERNLRFLKTGSYQ